MFNFYRFGILITFIFFKTVLLEGAEIKGHIYDRATKEQIIGGYIVIKPLNKGVVTGLDGSYTIKGIAPGVYDINISYLGYKQFDTTIRIADDAAIIKMDVYQQPVSNELKQVEVKGKLDAGSEAYASNREKNANVTQASIDGFNFHLASGSPAIGKGYTGFSPITNVPVDPNFGSSEITGPGKDLGCYQADGTGNQH